MSDSVQPAVQLIVGLGNPGPEYQYTRHNAGVWFVEQLARAYNCNLKPEAKFFGRTGNFWFRSVFGNFHFRLKIRLDKS